jgi:hypothetical protein
MTDIKFVRLCNDNGEVRWVVKHDGKYLYYSVYYHAWLKNIKFATKCRTKRQAKRLLFKYINTIRSTTWKADLEERFI